MQGLNLRRRDCVLCGAPIKGKGRIDRIYCSASCRTLAWYERSGRRHYQRRAARVLPSPGDYFPRGTLTQLAMQKEAELLAARQRIAELEGGALTLPPRDLRSELDCVQAELAEAKSAKAKLEEEGADLLHEWVEANQTLKAAEATNKKLNRELEAVRAELQQAAEQNKLPRSDVSTSRREPTITRQQLADLEASHKRILVDKQARIDELATAHAAQERDMDFLRNEHDQLQAELAQLRALAPNRDPLLFLMRTKVNLLHQLALAQERAGLYVTGRLLPDQDPRTRREAAIYAAYESRAEYYRQHSHWKTNNARWIHEGYRLDTKSEEAVREEQARVVKLLSGELGAARSSAL